MCRASFAANLTAKEVTCFQPQIGSKVYSKCFHFKEYAFLKITHFLRNCVAKQISNFGIIKPCTWYTDGVTKYCVESASLLKTGEAKEMTCFQPQIGSKVYS